jgi:chaperonin GroES
MELKPIGDRMIVKVVEIEEKSASGLIIPDAAKEAPTEGVVIAVGKKIEDVVKGDHVIFYPNAGLPIKGFPELRLMDPVHIVAVVIN